MSTRILQGDVFAQLPTIKPGSVDCCVTSPPYWMLRSYLPKGHPLKALEIGQEKTAADYVEKLVRVFRLVRDALADHGTCWVNVGDTYTHSAFVCMPSATIEGVEEGNMALIPERLAIALQDDGWIVRSKVIWHKPAPMPSSVVGWRWVRCRVKINPVERATNVGRNGDLTRQGAGVGPRKQREEYFATKEIDLWEDCPGCKRCNPNGGYVLRKGSWRPTSSYEPILMLAKTSDYFCDGEPVKTPGISSGGKGFGRVLDEEGTTEAGGSTRRCTTEDRERYDSGANLRDVWKTPLTEMSKEDLIGFIQGLDDGSLPDLWRIGAEPLKDGHYAAYPTELVRKCLLAGTSAKGCCPTCGKPWVRVIDPKAIPHPSPRCASTGSAGLAPELSTVGWKASCICPLAEPRPGLVLDPFSGSGRTAKTARWLGLDFVGVELNPEYVAMADRILREDSPLFSDDLI